MPSNPLSSALREKWEREAKELALFEAHGHSSPWILAQLAEARAIADALRDAERVGRQWECWVNVYPDGVVMPYSGQKKAAQGRSMLTDVETIRAHVVEVLDDEPPTPTERTE